MTRKILIVASVVGLSLVIIALGINSFTNKQIVSPLKAINNLKNIIALPVAANTISSETLFNGDCRDFSNFTASDNFKIVKPFYKYHNVLIGDGSNEFQQFLDVNGDGLLDYVKKDSWTRMDDNGTTGSNMYGFCVLINNGQELTDAYKCGKYFNVSTQSYKYIGDCAQ